MFRAAVAGQTLLGLEAKAFMDQGKLVPDEVTIGIVRERLAGADCVGGFLLDGFPRTVVQAVALDEVLANMGKIINAALNINVPEQVLFDRMAGRVGCTACNWVYNTKFNPPVQPGVCDKCGEALVQRLDDQDATVKNRLEVYHLQTAPLLDYYSKRGNLKNIDGNRDLDTVFRDIKQILDPLKQ
jgi:adenylate kinase